MAMTVKYSSLIRSERILSITYLIRFTCVEELV